MFAIALIAAAIPSSWGDEGGGPTVQPYIDSLGIQNQDPDSGAGVEPYLDKIKSKLKAEDEGSYTEELKQELNQKAQPSQGSYTEEEAAKLKPKKEGGAIQDVLDGHSELQAKMDKTIHNLFGLRIDAVPSRDFTASGASATASSFSTIYGTGFVPDFTLYYEFQPFHSEWLGNFGLVGMTGVAAFNGTGKFAQGLDLTNALTGTEFTAATTQFQFYELPLTAAVDYRFNLLRIIRPFVMVGASAIGYIEARSDTKPGHQGYSTALYASGGASLLLDWMAPKGSWQQYAANGIKHTYLTVDYTLINPLSGDVSFESHSVNIGVAFEF